MIASLYDEYTATHLTEALMNTFTLEKGKKGFQSKNSFVIEWDIKVEKIKRLPIIAVEGTGQNAGDVKFYFDENYYQKYDTFVIEETRQQFTVINRPQRLRDNCYLVIAKICDNDYDSVVMDNGDHFNMVGWKTRFVTNFMPELHKEGYVKYQSNCESHRVYMSTHRNDVDMSSLYNAMEDVFIQIGKGKDDDPVYKMNGAEKDCFDSFMLARNNKLLWGKCNVDENGKPKFYDPDTGEPIMTSDGR